MIERKQIVGKALAIAPLSSALLLATTFSVAAQTSEDAASDHGDPTISVQEQSVTGGARGWSRSQIERARPFPMPEARIDEPGTKKEMRPTGEVVTHPPGEPSVTEPMSRMEDRDASNPISHQTVRETDSEEPSMMSSSGQPFTSVRAGPRLITREFPHRAVGKLFFSTPDGNFVCSAAAISRRLIITAAHCVYDADEEEFYSNFRFFPAYDGTKHFLTPYCQWGWSRAIVPREYDGSVVGEYDFAIIQPRDRDCRRYQTRTMGEITGWLGFSTNLLVGNNITQLGYPVNLDGGQLMQSTHSDVVQRSGTIGEIGSAQSGGTSGGPWVQNFGNFADGMVPIGDNGFDALQRVVGVSSYGRRPHDTNQVSGASGLNFAWTRIWETACDWRADNC